MNETDVCNYVIDMLSEVRDRNKFGIEQRSNSYLSLIYCDNDFFRVKYTERAKWISISLAKEDKNKDDERFKAQVNKNQIHWKADINSFDDIKNFKQELINACKSYNTDEYVPRDINHSTITIGYKV